MNRFIVPVIAFGSGLAVITLILAVSSGDPSITIPAFFARPFSSWWYLGNMLNMAGLFILAGIGSSIAIKGGTFNLGGEGQLYASAFVTATLLSTAPLQGVVPPVAFILALFAASLTGAFLGFVPGILRARFRTNELLVSFLLSAAITPVVDYLVAGPLRDPTGNLLATKAIGKAFRLEPFALPSFFNLSFFFAIALALLAGTFLKKTSPGYRFAISGAAPEFSRFEGFSTETVSVASMTLSGLFHGLAGFFAITGTWYMCHQGITSGMGWSALSVALIAQANPIAVIPSAILYSWLETASDMAALSSKTGFDSTSIVQAIILLVVSARYIPRRKQKK